MFGFDTICPFIVTKEEAVELFKKKITKKWFMPKLAKQCANEASTYGVYIPYYVYDSLTASELTATTGKEHRVKDNDGNFHTEVDWDDVTGVYKKAFENVMVLVNKTYNKEIEMCEPYDLTKQVPEDASYYNGYEQAKITLSEEEADDWAKAKIHVSLTKEVQDYVKSHWNCERVKKLNFTTKYHILNHKGVMVPVWVISFKYKDKHYEYYVNGQTGKIYGSAPKAVLPLLFTILAILAVIVGIIIAIAV